MGFNLGFKGLITHYRLQTLGDIVKIRQDSYTVFIFEFRNNKRNRSYGLSVIRFTGLRKAAEKLWQDFLADIQTRYAQNVMKGTFIRS